MKKYIGAKALFDLARQLLHRRSYWSESQVEDSASALTIGH